MIAPRSSGLASTRIWQGARAAAAMSEAEFKEAVGAKREAVKTRTKKPRRSKKNAKSKKIEANANANAKAESPVAESPVAESPVEDEAAAGAEKHTVLNADVDPSEYEVWLRAGDEAAKKSAHYLAEFAKACRRCLPKVTEEYHRQKARQLVDRLTRTKAKAAAS